MVRGPYRPLEQVIKVLEGQVWHELHFWFWFLTEEIQYHDGLRSRELGQAPILLCAPNS